LSFPAFAEAPAASKMERLNDMVFAFTDAQLSQIKTAAFQVPHTKLYPVRIILPMTADMLARLDAVRGSQERVTVIREAVEHELKRRETARVIWEAVEHELKRREMARWQKRAAERAAKAAFNLEAAPDGDVRRFGGV
jgi:hypothetical protein